MRGHPKEIALVFLKLGCSSFGGPVAHIGYLHETCVVKRRWLGEAAFADLVALCQFLPGPASSQLVYALGMHRGGLPGALIASFCFTVPSLLLMLAFALGVSFLGEMHKGGWLQGLKVAAVAVVAQAVWGMGRKLCPDATRLLLALASAALVAWLPGALSQLTAIGAGALAGVFLVRSGQVIPPEDSSRGLARHHLWALGALGLFGLLLAVLPALAAWTDSKALTLLDGFYRAGSLVFGGGHVILPLLHTELVPSGWVTENAFLAGYGAAQALPGPLFTFAAYLGTLAYSGPQAWLGGLWCLLGIYLPALLLIGGALPFWDLIKSRPLVRSALHGTNAAVVGLLLSALYDPVMKQGLPGLPHIALVLVLFALLEALKTPSWLVVLLAALSGHWLL